MHPIERLRHVARIGPERPDLLAREAAAALSACANSAELVVAARRLLDRQPAAGPLWWVASRALTASDPREELTRAIEALAHDPTTSELEAALAQADPEVLVDAWSLGESGAYTSWDAHDAVAGTGATSRSVWAVAGVGRVLPAPVWQSVRARVDRAALSAAAVHIPAEAFAFVVTPSGMMTFHDAVAGADCPIAPELLTSR